MKLFSPEEGMVPSIDGAACLEYKHGPWRIVVHLFLLFWCIFLFQTISYFPQAFCLQPHEIGKKDFDHTMGVVNIKENASKLQRMVQRVDESCHWKS